jgi:hypothetical protein
MSFDKPTRNKLASMVGDCRSLLTDDIRHQLQAVNGIQPDGSALAVSALAHLDERGCEVASALRIWQEHLGSTEPGTDSQKKTAAFDRLARETAFTVLNRLAALRMCEERGHVIECVRRGMESDGFVLYERFSGGVLGGRGETYRIFLERMFAELSVDLGALFDLDAPQSLVFPRERCLEEVLALLNGPDLAHLWSQDETIGWIYQYFNSREEREAMREASEAPQNSRELAVRNQFFTPRYVVEFLVDNTLGRIWYEMRRGSTQLTEECRYLVRRPMEVFLGDPIQAYQKLLGSPEDEAIRIPERVAAAFRGELSDLPDEIGPDARWISIAIPPDQFEKYTGIAYAPFDSGPLDHVLDHADASINQQYADDVTRLWMASSHFSLSDSGSSYGHKPFKTLWNAFREAVQKHTAANENLSQEELLKQPNYIQYRPKKDPRDLRVLDPACGSGHFLLYAFELLEQIYEEAWSDQDIPPSEDTGRTLRQEFSTIEDLRIAAPKLIIDHNLYGIDIDSRAVQIAAFALWLHAQKTWRSLGIRTADRPRIAKSNIVTAEPMPGEEGMRGEFTADLKPRVLGQLVDAVFEKMKLAGETGPLLKVEEEIKDAVAEARLQWIEGPKSEQAELFREFAARKPDRQPLRFDFTGLTNEQFWEHAEDHILAALKNYAELTQNGHGSRRRLFAEDAARGFAFIEVCRKRYDVTLMNPPFGERPKQADSILTDTYPLTRNDMYAMFFERSFGLLKTRGKMGAISNRTWFGLPTFEDLRTRVFGELGAIECAADLGSFVLDAQVETAAVIAGEGTAPKYTAAWIRLLKTNKKEEMLSEAARGFVRGIRHNGMYLSSQARFSSMPTAVLGYWMSDRLIATYSADHSIGVNAADVKQGTSTADDFRFLRLSWEVPAHSVGHGSTWLPLAKGGEYSPYFDDIHLLLNWCDSGRELSAWGRGALRNTQYFGRAGITWPRRTTSAFSPRALPSGCAFGDKGPAAFTFIGIAPEVLLGVLASRPERLLLSVRLGAGDDAPGSASKSYEVGLIRDLPFPKLNERLHNALSAASLQCSTNKLLDYLSEDETASLFTAPPVLRRPPEETLRDLAARAVADREDRFVEYSELVAQIDEFVASSLEFAPQDRLVMNEELERPVAQLAGEFPFSENDFDKAYLTKSAISGEALPGGVEAESDVRVSTRRKKQSASLRTDECICRLFEMPPRRYVETRRALGLLRTEDIKKVAEDVISYAAGLAFGRFDIRLARFDLELPTRSAFQSHPSCLPGVLIGPDGLPAKPNCIVSEDWLRARPNAITLPLEGSVTKPTIPDSDYPLRISWDGILVDDPGLNGTQPHPDDIVRRVRSVLEALWKDRAYEIEQQACEILGVSELREYFRAPARFFQDHLKRYSKSRRQAPIYWPLSTSSGSYTLWVYYHRLNDDSLFTALNRFVKPKIDDTDKQLRQIESDLPHAVGRDAFPLRDRLEQTNSLLGELRELRDELARVAELPYKPNLNDGVLITASPLWKLSRLPKWRKDLEGCWKRLQKREYDWAHLAYSIWPDSVREICKQDRSIAIAHNLESLCEVAAKPVKKKRSKKLAVEETVPGDGE